MNGLGKEKENETDSNTVGSRMGKEESAEECQINWLLITSWRSRRKLESHHLAASMFDTFHVHLNWGSSRYVAPRRELSRINSGFQTSGVGDFYGRETWTRRPEVAEAETGVVPKPRKSWILCAS